MDNVAISPNKGLTTRIPQALGSAVVGTCLVALLCCAFGPLWETNDDVGMSMIAGGYGLATVGSPKIIFSNVLWGHLIRLIPTIDGTPGYSIATLVVLILVASGIVYSMRRLGLVYAESIVIAVLLLARPIILPQFTMNAGLLAVVGVAFWCVYAQCYELRLLLLGCVLLVLGFLVRNTECVLILIVAAPLLPWRALRAKRAPKVVAAILLSTLVVSSIIDHEAYQKPEWRSFNDLNLVRSAFTDFGAGASLQKRPDILARHGYTENDLELIESWFFVDPVLAKPARLQALIRDLGPIPAGTMAPENIWLAVTSLWDRALLPILLVAMLFAILRPSRRVFMCWGLGAAAILAMGVIGRPAIMRVYIPLVSMLVVAPFLVKGSKQAFSHFSRSTLLVVLFLMTLNSFFLISDFEEIKQNSEDVTEALARLPERAVVIWGAALPYQFAYSVFHMPHALMDLKIYGLGVITLAPVSTAYADEKAGRGLLTMLSEKEGVPLISVPGQIDLLRGYCAEHLQGNFQVLSALHFKFFDFGRYRCEHRTP